VSGTPCTTFHTTQILGGSFVCLWQLAHSNMKQVTADCFIVHRIHSFRSVIRWSISYANKLFLRATDPSHHRPVLSLHKMLHNSQIPTATASLHALAGLQGTTCYSCSRSLYVLPFSDLSLKDGLKEVRLIPREYVRSLYPFLYRARIKIQKFKTNYLHPCLMFLDIKF